jgi:hypothetical protein
MGLSFWGNEWESELQSFVPNCNKNTLVPIILLRLSHIHGTWIAFILLLHPGLVPFGEEIGVKFL